MKGFFFSNFPFHFQSLTFSDFLIKFNFFATILEQSWGFPGGSEVKESACNAGDLGSISGSGRSPGEGNGNLLQYSCLENPMDKGAWWAIVHGVTELDMTERLHFHFSLIPAKVLKVKSWQLL